MVFSYASPYPNSRNTAQGQEVDSKTLRRKFGQKLRQIRRHHHVTQERLAELLGCSVEHISLLERGLTGASFDLLAKLTDVFGMVVKDLFDF